MSINNNKDLISGRFLESSAALASAQSRFVENAERFVTAAVKLIYDKYPTLEAFSWNLLQHVNIVDIADISVRLKTDSALIVVNPNELPAAEDFDGFVRLAVALDVFQLLSLFEHIELALAFGWDVTVLVTPEGIEVIPQPDNVDDDDEVSI